MKLIDFDGLFDEKLAKYIEENKEKHTEKQWEEIIPRLYKKFGDTFVAKIKCTPKEYYAKMSETELAETLAEHLAKEVPVPEFLCAEIESRDAVAALLPLLKSQDEATVSYAINLIADDARAFDSYFEILKENRLSEDIQNDAVEIFKLHADDVKEQVFSLYNEGYSKEYCLEILSRVKTRDERVYGLLLSAFLSAGENLPMRSSYLAAYGDERALPYLLERIEDTTIGFVEFQELKYAIEALGGEYDEPRDFTEDKDYLAVEAAGNGIGKSSEEGLPQS
ncbi:MAG: hypothetical protein IJ506_02520 [Clostridia bacterium]|nr:hypothetical protein [Clostridia bacterium]